MTNEIFPELPDSAMVLAAGYGLRLRPLTLSRPKPLVRVGGMTLIDRTLDRLAEAGIRRAVVNLHYRGDMLEAHLAQRTEPEIVFAREEVLLDTGGGVLNALEHFGGAPFLAVNSDMIWRDGFGSTLQRMGRAFDPETMDALLLLMPTVFAIGYRGAGDFTMAPDGRLTRKRRGRVAPFLFTGIQILKPDLFEGMEVEPFSLNRIYDLAAERGRLFGIRHEGDWVDVGTRPALELAEAFLKQVT
ncbi:MAG: nucleotidyltransferase family protein [Minwuia sp.]|uniref:nucleotidyltransferase family protein n=1 Tax=Minwuia sp. TaxID=2493630 RepID=UPI003A870BDB